MISFLALRCSVLSAPDNGRLENVACGNVYGSVCRLSCHKGYELKGSVERKCDKITGTNVVQWTGNTTSCEGKLPRSCLVAGNAWNTYFDARVSILQLDSEQFELFSLAVFQKMLRRLFDYPSPTFLQFSNKEE